MLDYNKEYQPVVNRNVTVFMTLSIHSTRHFEREE
jgi:hypothetical protein